MVYKKGFTLIEVILAVSLVAVTAAFVFPLGINQLQSNQVEEDLVQVFSQMKELQQRALADNENYGIVFLSVDQFAVFTGSSYSEATNSITQDFNGAITIVTPSLSDSSNEIVFLAGTQTTSTTGSVLIGSDINNYTITINDEGFIDFTQN